jgi:hypothetical protein
MVQRNLDLNVAVQMRSVRRIHFGVFAPDPAYSCFEIIGQPIWKKAGEDNDGGRNPKSILLLSTEKSYRLLVEHAAAMKGVMKDSQRPVINPPSITSLMCPTRWRVFSKAGCGKIRRSSAFDVPRRLCLTGPKAYVALATAFVRTTHNVLHHIV